jgi:hypothetical protein
MTSRPLHIEIETGNPQTFIRVRALIGVAR